MRKFNLIQKNGLPLVKNADSLESTTTLHANRKRYLSGIFLSKFHLSEYQSLKGVIHSLTEFAIRAICRNKAETIRTNKASRCNAVVEPLSHPLGAVHSFNLTETLQTMNKPTQTPNGIIAKLTAFPFVLSAKKGACYA